MGTVFEELIRKFAELSNETAGEHFTPREVIRLMVNLIFAEDDEVLSKPGVVRTIYDPTAGTGGMLSVAGEWLHEHNPKARLTMFGQELNDEAYAICKADMLIKGQDVGNIKPDDTLGNDGHAHQVFDYMLSNPPFGVEWKQSEKAVPREHEQQGYNGRFGPGLPRISDGSLLFMLHLVKKMRPLADGGARFCIVQNGSPLFTGGAGSGESNIRQYLLENDLVEAIIALPTDMFYNTGISTYLWVVTNKKLPARKGKLQLIDASSFWQKMRKSLGSKRKELSPEHIEEITRVCSASSRRSGGRRRHGGADLADLPERELWLSDDHGGAALCGMLTGNVVVGTKGKMKGKPHARSRPARHRERAAGVRMWRRTSSARCCRMRRTLGSTTKRPRWGTRSHSTGTSTSSSRHGTLRRSTPTSRWSPTVS
jgi:type I restriction enzyme M protein